MFLKKMIKKIFSYFEKPFLIFHKTNFYVSKLIYFLSFKKNLHPDKETIQKKRFIFYNKENHYRNSDEKLIKILNNFCDYTMSYKKNENLVKYVIKKNFTFMQYNLSNQKHCDELNSNLMNELKFALLNSDILKLAECFFKCKYTVVNIRSWIFYPVKNTTDNHVKKHVDGFPKGFLKIMYYQGNFFSEPALEIFLNNEKIKVDGTSPLVLFDPNIIPHSAQAPSVKERPTVEITLMPKNFKKFDVQQSGFQAGFPVSPFRKTNLLITDILKS